MKNNNDDEINDKLKTLYKEYNEEIGPLLVLVETEIERFPIGILNEIRALHDHISRIYEDIKIETKMYEIDSAKRHMWRVMLDCNKWLCQGIEDKIERFYHDYRGVKLGEVNSGRFLPELSRKTHLAKENFGKAKGNERKGRELRQETLDLYRQATESYYDIISFIESQYENLAWAANYQRRHRWRDITISAIISLVIGIIVTLIFKGYSQ